MNKMNKIVVIAGQTGVGKTGIANNIARKINGEIICIDTIQLYKDLNIIANKPSKFLQECVKYHNVNEYNLFNGNISGILHAEKIRKIIKEIWSRNKIPVLEGGCGFYFKMILTGGSAKFTSEEEKEFDKNLKIAKELIKYDSSFEKTFSRLLRIDNTVPEDAILKNDNYRLEKRLTEAITFGNGAYKLLREREEKLRNQNKFSDDISIYNFFLYCDKIRLNKKLEDRCEQMIESGIIKEVSDLIFENKITPQMFLDQNMQAVFLNAFGLYETINFLNALIENKEIKYDIIKAYGNHVNKKDKNHNKNKKSIEKLIYSYLNDFSSNNRNYARRQAIWFKNNDNYLWIDSEKEISVDNLIIEKYLKMSKEEFLNVKNSIENKNTKDSYNYKQTKNWKYVSKFNMLNAVNKNKIKNLIEEGFSYSEKNGEKLLEIKNNLIKINSEKNKVERENNNFVKSTDLIDSPTENAPVCSTNTANTINLELIEKYFKF